MWSGTEGAREAPGFPDADPCWPGDMYKEKKAAGTQVGENLLVMYA